MGFALGKLYREVILKIRHKEIIYDGANKNIGSGGKSHDR
jgi:hypothetical protein